MKAVSERSRGTGEPAREASSSAVADPLPTLAPIPWRPWLLDRLLLLLLVAVAFLLGCYEMGDTDVWWHLRGGQWILEHGHPPGLDPFTFGSADRPWVDVHWFYEVVLALAYRAGGTGALVLLGATLGSVAFVAALTGQRREWPLAVVALCWLPALVLFGFRLDPRPEIFSLALLGSFLAVLRRAEDRLAWIWLLVPLQVLWANVQGLFILGPILVGLFLAARVVALLREWLCGPALVTMDSRWWLQAGLAFLAVSAACLVNPYFLDGARFPFDLYPKVTESGNIYKRYVDELMSPHDYVGRAMLPEAGCNWFFLSFYFLLLLLPVSFFWPVLWRASLSPSSSVPGKGQRPLSPSPSLWGATLAGVVGLLVVHLLTLSNRWVPEWLVFFGSGIPLLVVAGSCGLAFLLRRRPRPLVFLVLVSGVGLGLWMLWLQSALLAGQRGPLSAPEVSRQLTAPLALVAILGGVLIPRWGGNPFRLLLAGAFGYLALQALQNWSRFALVAGTVLSWNLAEWAVELRGTGNAEGKWTRKLGWLPLGILALWAVALPLDQYYRYTGEPRRLAFREQPLEFAHDAAAFAGQEGLPRRALVYGLGQTGVYVFHNAPACKPFLDGRLEMPERKTFETYVAVEDWLRARDPRWRPVVAGMGNPLLLLEHANNFGAEAGLLTNPDWRCVYFDALAAVFVPREGVDERAFPSVDFAARHFAVTSVVPNVPGAALRELRALSALGTALPPSAGESWRSRTPVLLLALDRGRQALNEEPERPEPWTYLGLSYWNLRPDAREKPLTPAEPWTLERGIYWAQAAYCFRRACAAGPRHVPSWRYLADAYRVRGMADAQLATLEQLAGTDPKFAPQQREQLEQLRGPIGSSHLDWDRSREQPLAFVQRLLANHRPQQAAAFVGWTERAGEAVRDWPFAEVVGGLYLHLGQPTEARRVWQQATGCPSDALRSSRLASTYWVERDFPAAERHFRQALGVDQPPAEAFWGLAMLLSQQGDAAGAAAVCRAGLAAPLQPPLRKDLTTLLWLTARTE